MQTKLEIGENRDELGVEKSSGIAENQEHLYGSDILEMPALISSPSYSKKLRSAHAAGMQAVSRKARCRCKPQVRGVEAADA